MLLVKKRLDLHPKSNLMVQVPALYASLGSQEYIAR